MGDKVTRIGDYPFRIELLKSLSRFSFDEAFQRKKVTTVEGVKVNALSFNDLILSKHASGREKDREDIKMLQKIKRSIKKAFSKDKGMDRGDELER